MERNYIQWNVVNWITIFLMATIGYTVISGLISVISPKLSGGQNG